MSENQIIKPKAISGFPEWLPQEKIVENRFLDVIRSSYERFGFVPIETPAIEREETLTAKGGSEREIYGIHRLVEDPGMDDTKLAMHFDLTVPLARYVAEHYNDLSFPFRRYQIQKVWRGERAQAGRYREFYQCDIDAIGDGALDLTTDAEIPSVIYQVFSELNIGEFLIRINNRKVLQGFVKHLGINADTAGNALRTLDKLEKIGVQKVEAELLKMGLDAKTSSSLIDLMSLHQEPSKEVVLNKLDALCNDAIFVEGVNELRTVAESLALLGVPDSAWSLDTSVVRGLDYYTGTIYETVLVKHPEVGSICSGGRYENLAGYFSRRSLPGVGISIGLTRLLSRLFQAGIIESGVATTSQVLVTVMNRARLGDYLTIATMLRNAHINTELYLEERSLKAQMKFGAKRGFPAVVIASDEELDRGVVQLRHLDTGDQNEVALSDLVAQVGKLHADGK